MAESVKNNCRIRKPPSYFYNDVYNPDQIDSSITSNLLIKEQAKNGQESNTNFNFARILLKFTRQTNKAYRKHEAQIDSKSIDKESERTPNKRFTPKTKNLPYQETFKSPSNFRGSEKMLGKPNIPQSESQKKQTKNSKQPQPPTTLNSVQHQTRRQQLEREESERPISQMIPPTSLEALHLISQNQFRKCLNEGINSTLFNDNFLVALQQFKNENSGGKREELNINLQNFNKNSKVFKRASYHIGIAEYIHVEKIKKSNKNSWEEFDPTIHSRRFKQTMMKQLEDEVKVEYKNQPNNLPSFSQQPVHQQKYFNSEFSFKINQNKAEQNSLGEEKNFKTHKKIRKSSLKNDGAQSNNNNDDNASYVFEEPQFMQIQFYKKGEQKNEEEEMENEDNNEMQAQNKNEKQMKEQQNQIKEQNV